MTKRTTEEIMEFFGTRNLKKGTIKDVGYALVFPECPVAIKGPWKRCKPWYGWHDNPHLRNAE